MSDHDMWEIDEVKQNTESLRRALYELDYKINKRLVELRVELSGRLARLEERVSKLEGGSDGDPNRVV